MELEQDTLNALVTYLIQHGYPENSMAFEWPIGRYRVDLAIIDPDTGDPIALFEVKSQITHQSEKMGIKQLSSFWTSLNRPNIPTYLVFRSNRNPPFEIKRIDLNSYNSEEGSNYSPESILPFTTLIGSRRNIAIEEKVEERKKILDWFWIICWIYSIGAIYLFYKDYFEAVSLSNSQITLIGVISVLTLLPFASRLKILGVEYERRTK